MKRAVGFAAAFCLLASCLTVMPAFSAGDESLPRGRVLSEEWQELTEEHKTFDDAATGMTFSDANFKTEYQNGAYTITCITPKATYPGWNFKNTYTEGKYYMELVARHKVAGGDAVRGLFGTAAADSRQQPFNLIFKPAGISGTKGSGWAEDVSVNDTANTWYNLGIEVDLTAQTYQLYINGEPDTKNGAMEFKNKENVKLGKWNLYLKTTFIKDEYIAFSDFKMWKHIDPALGGNLALGKAVSSDAEAYSLSSYPHSNMTDGKLDTRLVLKDGKDHKGKYIQVDLGVPTAVNMISMKEMKARLVRWQYQYSADGTEWKNLGGEQTQEDSSENINQHPQFTFPDVTARYLRILILENRTENGAQKGPCIWEFEVYHKAASVGVEITELTKNTAAAVCTGAEGAKIVCAVYDAAQNLIWADIQSAAALHQFSWQEEEAAQVRMFLWSDMESALPLAAAADREIQSQEEAVQ